MNQTRITFVNESGRTMRVAKNDDGSAFIQISWAGTEQVFELDPAQTWLVALFLRGDDKK